MFLKMKMVSSKGGKSLQKKSIVCSELKPVKNIEKVYIGVSIRIILRNHLYRKIENLIQAG